MNDLSIEEINKLGCEERYEVFLAMVAESREIWILINPEKEFLKIHSQDHELEFLPVWPDADFAKLYAKEGSEQLSPKCIAIPEFFAKWVPGLDNDDLLIGVLPRCGSDVWMMEPYELKSDLQDEFSNFSL